MPRTGSDGCAMPKIFKVMRVVLSGIVLFCALMAPVFPVQQPGHEAIKIVDKPIDFGSERQKLTLEYRRTHQDPEAQDITIHPQLIILHYTVTPTFTATWNYFNQVHAEGAREQLAAAGDVNVSAHFVVDRDGTIYRLLPETWMARHCIGLNHVAIGVENVGDNDKLKLTPEQVAADAALVRYLAAKYPITVLLGHHEYRRMEQTKYFLERDPKYWNTKSDPGDEFMTAVRAKVADLHLGAPPQ